MSYQPPNPNPYASPAYVSPEADPHSLPSHVVTKAEAIIKDAGQFWLAIIMCIFCSALGAVIIGPWYLTRLLQWNSLGRENPRLLEPSPHGSLAQRFQGAKIKLIIGMTFGFFVLGVVLLLVVANVLLAS